MLGFSRRRQINQYYKAKEKSSGLERAIYEIRDNELYFTVHFHTDVFFTVILESMHKTFVDSFYYSLFENMKRINIAEQADEIGKSLISNKEVEMKVSANAFGVAVALTLCRIAKEADAIVDEAGLKSYLEENIDDEHIDDIIEAMTYAIDYYYDPLSEFGSILGSWEAGAITNLMLNKPVEKGHYADPLLGTGTGIAMLEAFSLDNVANLVPLVVDNCIEMGLITKDKKIIDSQNKNRAKRHLGNLTIKQSKKAGSSSTNKRRSEPSGSSMPAKSRPEKANSRRLTREEYEEKIKKKVLKKVSKSTNTHVENNGCLVCSGCGKSIPSADYNFCPSCGKELVEESDDF